MRKRTAVGLMLAVLCTPTAVLAEPKYDPSHGRDLKSAPQSTPLHLKSSCTFWPCNPHKVCHGWDANGKCIWWVKEWDICTHCPDDWKVK
jgi:hypothetical protein